MPVANIAPLTVAESNYFLPVARRNIDAGERLILQDSNAARPRQAGNQICDRDIGLGFDR